MIFWPVSHQRTNASHHLSHSTASARRRDTAEIFQSDRARSRYWSDATSWIAADFTTKDQRLVPKFRQQMVDSAETLLTYLSLLFVPIGVGVIMHLQLDGQLLAVLSVIIVGTIATLIFRRISVPNTAPEARP